MRRVYLAGPMSRGDRVENLSQALKTYRALIRLGYAPMCPQLTFFAEPFIEGMGHQDWLNIDLAWVAVSEAVFRIPGESKGADMEVAYAQSLGIPVYHSLESLVACERSCA